MKIDHVWTVICSNAVIDKDTNNVSLHNIIEQINITKNDIEPGSIIGVDFEVITLWIRSKLAVPSEATSHLSLVAPDGEIFRTIELGVNLSKAERVRNRLRIQGLPFKGFGQYNFRLEIFDDEKDEWRIVANIPLTISQSPAAEEEKDEILPAKETN